MKAESNPYPIRLQNGANKILSRCKSKIWWHIYNLPTSKNSGYCSKEFISNDKTNPGFCEFMDFYMSLLKEATIYYRNMSPDFQIPNPLNDKIIYEQKDSIEFIMNMENMYQLEGSGVCFKYQIRKDKYVWICDSKIQADIVDDGEPALCADELESIVEMHGKFSEIDPDTQDKYLETIFKVKRGLSP